MKKLSRVLRGDSIKFSSDPMFLFWPELDPPTSKLNDSHL